MKFRRKAVAVLLSLALVVTLMPAVAFAADESGSAGRAKQTAAQKAAEKAAREDAVREELRAKEERASRPMAGDEHNTKLAKKLTYKGNTEIVPAGVDSDGEPNDAFFEGFYTEGNEIIVEWDDDDGTTDRYICREYNDPRYGEDDFSLGYFLNGEDAVFETNDEGELELTNRQYFDWEIDGNEEVKLTYEYDYYYQVDDDGDTYWEDVSKEISTEFQGLYPKGISYTGTNIYYYEEDGPENADVYVEGARFDITYNDGSVRKIVCKKYKDYIDDEGDKSPQYEFFFEDEEPVLEKDSDGDECPLNATHVSLDYEKATANSLPVEYKGVKGSIPIHAKHYPIPVSVKFTPVSNFSAYGMIGDKYAYGLQEPGNEIEITYKSDDGNIVKKYVCTEDYNYVNVEDKGDMFYPEVKFAKRIKKGTNTMSGMMLVEADTGRYYEDFWLPVSVRVMATEYYAYIPDKTYTYTGKKITPKVEIKYWTGSKFKTMPKSWYTCKPKKNSKYGWYDLKATIKKKYRKKYGWTIWGGYQIAPKKPAIKKVSAGKGTIKVTWKKFSKADQKKITKFYVAYCTNKSFRSFNIEEAKKSAGSLTIKNLKKGDKYYIRVYAIKTSGGEDYWSAPANYSKLVTVK